MQAAVNQFRQTCLTFQNKKCSAIKFLACYKKQKCETVTYGKHFSIRCITGPQWGNQWKRRKKDSLCLADSLRERNSKSWANVWLCIVTKVFVSLTRGDFNAICIFVYKYFSRCLGCSIKRMHWNVSPYTDSATADAHREPMRSRLHVTCFPKNRSLLPLQSSLSDFSLSGMRKPGEGWLNGCS